ncbi:hypothetical protein SeMB42_g04495 [Synchytrium endobioticum]|uniref:Uncharacterized protein n=1 Tax=Synchytrium endobioticum TaxID=286115 RepID=A0A507CXU5_9FUNG|nr:hypothetical protein SeMB42_g04495 [Synchytrium endobioticum]
MSSLPGFEYVIHNELMTTGTPPQYGTVYGLSSEGLRCLSFESLNVHPRARRYGLGEDDPLSTIQPYRCEVLMTREMIRDLTFSFTCIRYKIELGDNKIL